ncbi:deubiquitinase DESI2, partial [Phenoliferia sp. Uapishka_3]
MPGPASPSPAPLTVHIIVYDLLPPGRLASVLNTIGAGVYHSSVSLSIPLGPDDRYPTPKEYAFGGHYVENHTGIFSVPEGTAALRMPGLRYYLTFDAGECFGSDWEKVFGPKGRRGSGLERARSRLSVDQRGGVEPLTTSSWEKGLLSPSSSHRGPYEAFASSRTTSQLSISESDGYYSPTLEQSGSFEDLPQDDWCEDDGGERDGTQYLNKYQRRAYRIIEKMREEPEWEGTKYNLLNRNCNTFTDELIWRLTGRRAPSYLNRAAWFATSAPCLIPAGWIDEPNDESTSENTDSSHVVIAPPRADQMSHSVGR